MRRQHSAHPRGPSLLILRGGGLARFLAAVPAYRALRRAFPRHHAVIATSGWLRPLIRLTDALDDVLPTRPRLGRLTWSGPSPDVAVNLHDRGPESHLLLHSLWPARTIAFASPAAPDGLEGPAWRDEEPESVRWCRLLESFGIEADPQDVWLSPPEVPSPAPGAVVVHTGTPPGRAPWPVASYAQVVQTLREAGHQVVVTGWGLHGVGLDTRPAAGWDDPSEGHVRDLGALATLVAECSLLICGDPEVAALARAYGKPSITVYGESAYLRSGDDVTGVLARTESLLAGEPVRSVVLSRTEDDAGEGTLRAVAPDGPSLV